MKIQRDTREQSKSKKKTHLTALAEPRKAKRATFLNMFLFFREDQSEVTDRAFTNVSCGVLVRKVDRNIFPTLIKIRSIKCIKIQWVLRTLASLST